VGLAFWIPWTLSWLRAFHHHMAKGHTLQTRRMPKFSTLVTVLSHAASLAAGSGQEWHALIQVSGDDDGLRACSLGVQSVCGFIDNHA